MVYGIIFFRGFIMVLELFFCGWEVVWGVGDVFLIFFFFFRSMMCFLSGVFVCFCVLGVIWLFDVWFGGKLINIMVNGFMYDVVLINGNFVDYKYLSVFFFSYFYN